MNTPKYLLFDFQGYIHKTKELELEIDLTNYSMSNLGPKKYNLYAYIREDENKEYVSYINYKNDWYKFFEENNIKKILNSEISYCYPTYIAIYRGVS